MRLFFSLPVPPDACARIAGAIERAPGFSWSPAEQLHFTLAFLGEQPTAAVAQAVTALEKERQFDLAIGGAGAFPSERKPRVLWLGVTEGADRLVALATALVADLRARGLQLDTRPFRPHLTIGRARRAGAAFPRLPSEELARFRATHVDLVQSHLGQSARHETLKRFPLLD